LGFVGIIDRVGGYVAAGPAQAGKLDLTKHLKHLRHTLALAKATGIVFGINPVFIHRGHIWFLRLARHLAKRTNS
jgi:hypothetical protein